jgi:hypothetical protein
MNRMTLTITGVFSASSLMLVDSAVKGTPDLVTVTDSSVREVWSWNWISALPLVWTVGFVVLMLRLSAARWILWNCPGFVRKILPTSLAVS